MSATFPKFLWDRLLPQTELALNFLRQSAVAPTMSAWDHFNGPFNFDATPIAPLGSPIIIHTKPGNRRLWDYRGRKGFIIGPPSITTAALESSTPPPRPHSSLTPSKSSMTT